MKKISVILLVLFVASCNNSGTKEKEPVAPSKAYQLVGEWNNLYIKIETMSKNNTDSNEVLEVDRPQWEEKLKIKPIRSFFRADSTWNSAHYNLKDSLVFNPSGKWWIANDQLVWLQLSPSPDTTIYNVSINKDTATFEALVDWDMDGKKDDKYLGRQIKVNRQ